MAMFNFVSKPQPKLDEIIKNLTTMIGPQMVTAPQAGPVMPGESLPAITAMQEGTGKATIDKIKALAGLATSRAPGIAQVGTNQIASLMAGPETQDPTRMMQNFAFLEQLQQQDPEKAARFKELIMKPGMVMDMGQKYITAADAQKMRNADNEMPPIGLTFDQAMSAGYKWVDPQAIAKSRETEEKLGGIEQSFNTYKDMATEYGAMSPVNRFTNPNKYQKFSGAYAALQLQIKELENLGVLAGPDMDLIERVIQDPTSVEANAAQYFSGQNPLIGQLNLVEEKIKAAKERAVKLYGVDYRKKAREMSKNKTVNFEDLP